jgi:GntR family transcriptional regulator
MTIMPRPAERPGDRVGADLRRRLTAGEWRSGDVLPTTRELAEAYEVSQATVSRVIRLLEAEGLVRTVDRWAVVKS